MDGTCWLCLHTFAGFEVVYSRGRIWMINGMMYGWVGQLMAYFIDCVGNEWLPKLTIRCYSAHDNLRSSKLCLLYIPGFSQQQSSRPRRLWLQIWQLVSPAFSDDQAWEPWQKSCTTQLFRVVSVNTLPRMSQLNNWRSLHSSDVP